MAEEVVQEIVWTPTPNRILPNSNISRFGQFRESTLFAATLSVSIHISSQSDTIPEGQEYEASRAAEVFRDHYIAGFYPQFKGSITRIAAGTYRLDSFTMQIHRYASALSSFNILSSCSTSAIRALKLLPY